MNFSERREISAWTSALECSEEELLFALQAVGNSHQEVQYFLGDDLGRVWNLDIRDVGVQHAHGN